MITVLLTGARLREHEEALHLVAHEEGETLRLVGMDEAERRRHLLRDVEVAWYSLDLLDGGSPMGDRSRRFFKLLQDCPRLRWLHVMSAGEDLPLYEDVRGRGVTFSCGSGIAAEPVAHSAVAALMALSRGFGHWLPAQRRREWLKIPSDRLPRDLPGQHALVLGLGPIGIEVGRLLHALSMKVTGARRQALPMVGFDRTIVYGQLLEAACQADWLIICCPLSDATRGLVDASVLQALPAGAGVINVSRGAVIDEAALLDALASGHVGAAYLDVFETEPLPEDSPFWEMPNVWISPHNAAASRGNVIREVALFKRNLKKFLAGRTLENVR